MKPAQIKMGWVMACRLDCLLFNQALCRYCWTWPINSLTGRYSRSFCCTRPHYSIIPIHFSEHMGWFKEWKNRLIEWYSGPVLRRALRRPTSGCGHGRWLNPDSLLVSSSSRLSYCSSLFYRSVSSWKVNINRSIWNGILCIQLSLGPLCRPM